MSDLSNAAPQPFDSGAAARALYGDAHANDAKPADPVLDSDAAKMWPGFTGRENQPQPVEQRQPEPAPKTEPTQFDQKPDLGEPNDAPDLRSQFDEHVTALNIPSDQAAQLYDQMAPVIADQQREQLEAQIDAWADDSRQHFGDDGLQAALSHSKLALEHHAGGRELMTLLDKSGLSAHKAVLTFFDGLGRKVRR